MEWNHDTSRASLERVAEPRRGRRSNEPRPYVLTRLLKEDPEYRAYFARLFDEMMNHRVHSGVPARTLRATTSASPSIPASRISVISRCSRGSSNGGRLSSASSLKSI